MTSCTASWRETNPNVGDAINADFTWEDAVWHWTGEFYCQMSVYDPTGERRAYHVEIDDDTGSHTLTIPFANIPGEWTCTIEVWDGNAYVVCNDYVLVSAAGTLCSANWREVNPEVGDTINADFTWSNAREHGSGIYCSMGIYDPSGALVDSYDELVNETGNYTLSVTANEAGQWQCVIAAWTGFAWLYANDAVYVMGTSEECIGGIFQGNSVFYTGPFDPGTNQLLAELCMQNLGMQDGCLIYAKFVEYPGQSNETQLGGLWGRVINGGELEFIDFYWDTPTNTTSWPIGVKVWAPDYEEEPLW